jgi:hypothetical protein
MRINISKMTAIAKVPELSVALEQLQDHMQQRSNVWTNSNRAAEDLSRFAASVTPQLAIVSQLLYQQFDSHDENVDPGRVFEQAVMLISNSVNDDYRVFQELADQTLKHLNESTERVDQQSRILTLPGEDAITIRIDRTERSLSLLAYCCAIQSLRKIRDSSTSASDFVTLSKRTQDLTGIPIAYFYKALASISDQTGDGANDLELKKGYEYALAALDRFSRSPGAHNLVAKYEYELMMMTGSASTREELRSKGYANVSTAIRLDPEYPAYFFLRGLFHIEEGRSDLAISDLKIARSLAISNGEKALAEEYETRTQQVRFSLVNEKRLAEAQNINIQLRSVLEESNRALSQSNQRLEALERDFTQVRTLSSETIRRVDEVESRNLREFAKIETGLSESRREQVQLVAVVAAVLAIIQVSVGVGAEAVDGGITGQWRPILLLAIPLFVAAILIFFLFWVNRLQQKGAKQLK